MNKSVNIKLMEFFGGFVETGNTSALELANKMLESITSHSLDMSKCRGQGYDGAANMSGLYSGVQSKIREMEPPVTYVRCAVHNLNLVLNDAVKNIPEMEQFYNTVEHIYMFFAQSIKR